MPDYTYRGTVARTYPENRDAYQVHVGTVEPGDVLELDEPLDPDWWPYEASGDSGGEEKTGTPETASDGTGDELAS